MSGIGWARTPRSRKSVRPRANNSSPAQPKQSKPELEEEEEGAD